jgi:hypothetical protein
MMRMPGILPAASNAPAFIRVDVFSSSDIYDRELLGRFLIDLDRELADRQSIPSERLKLILKNLANGIQRATELQALAVSALAEEHAAAPIRDETVTIYFEGIRHGLRVVRRPAGLVDRLARIERGNAAPARADEVLELRRDAALARQMGRAMMRASAEMLDAGRLGSEALPTLLAGSINMQKLAIACSRLAVDLEDGPAA